MKYLKLFEEYKYNDVGSNADRQRSAAFHDAISGNVDDKRKTEFDKIKKDIEDPGSEEGGNWSDNERKRLDKWLDTFAKEYDVPGTKESKITQLCNDMFSTIKDFDKRMDYWRDLINSEAYEPMGDSDKVPKEMLQKLNILIDELKEIDEKLEFWREKTLVDEFSLDYYFADKIPTLRDHLEKEPNLIPEAEKMIDLVRAKCDEMEKLMGRKGLDFTLKR
jgi:hypothetical protein